MQRLFLLLLLVPSLGESQNLVPNPSFEEYDCNDPWSTLPWFGGVNWFNPNTATPDIWSLTEIADCGVRYIYDNDALSAGEWQWPHSGERYLGLYHIYESGCTREYIEARLTESLLAGYTYCIELYVSLANRSKFCTDCIGVSFSMDSLVNFDTYCDLDLPFAVWNDTGSSVCDTLNWTLISGEYLAEGGEQYIIVGNVRSNEECVLQPTIGSDPTWSNAGYYFIDDVNVMLCEEPESVTTLPDMNIAAFPNPFTDQVVVTVPSGAKSYRLLSSTGEIVMSANIYQEKFIIDSTTLPQGLYLLCVSSGELILRQKLIKE